MRVPSELRLHHTWVTFHWFKQVNWSIPESKWEGTTQSDGKGHEHRKGRRAGTIIQSPTLGKLQTKRRVGNRGHELNS